jgi:hypothetical protein
MAMVLFLGAVIALAGCESNTNGKGGLNQAEKDAAKAAALEDYNNDREGFEEFVDGMNSLKGWDLPQNPHSWSSSHWNQYYSFIDEYRDGNDWNDGNGNGNGDNTGWPNSSVLAEWGLSGMSPPVGAGNIQYWIATIGGHSLSINFTGSSANDDPVHTWLTSNGWAAAGDYSYGGIISRMYAKEGFEQASYTRNGSTCQIQIVKD